MPTKPPKLLVLSVSAGAGHVRAAQALCAQAARSHPGWQVEHVDVMDWVPPAFRTVYVKSYLKMVEKAPLLWAFLYQQIDKQKRTSKTDRLRRGVEKLNTRRFDGEIERIAPDAIVCTHFLPAELLSRRIRKRKPTPPVWVQVTDFDVHGMWLHEHMQGYFVASDEVGARIEARGVKRERVHVVGIPIMPAFTEPPSRLEAARELGIDPQVKTLVMMSGGEGVGGIDALATHLASLDLPLQIIALAGRNEALLRKLQSAAAQHPGRIVPMGFTMTIERVMAAADVAVTKPGGLTSSECLAMNLPMIVVSPIPGQEERNADYLLESGAALKAVDASALLHKVRRLIAHPEEIDAMRASMRRVARPRAAADVLAHVARHVGG